MGIVRLFAALAVLACACAYGDAGESGDINAAILARYEAINGSQDDHVRARNLQALEQLLSGLDAGSVRHVNDDSVERLSTLLGDDRSYHRYYVARALGGISCRAKGALPALRQVFKPLDVRTGEIEIQLVLGPNPDDEVRRAIARIEASSPCSHVPNALNNAAEGSHHRAPPQDEIFLPRIVAIDDDLYYPDGFRWSGATPASLGEAVDAMFLALPKVDAEFRDLDVCTFASLDELDSGFRACKEAACLRVPLTSRERRGCGYLVRLAGWMEEAWLGGLCVWKVEQRSGALTEWFRSRGVFECHQMSTVLSVALAQALIGNRQHEDEILHLFLTADASTD